VEGSGDGSFDAGDYIVFYAKKNTAWLDSMIYENPMMFPINIIRIITIPSIIIYPGTEVQATKEFKVKQM
jgi:hypothetical protein